MDRVVGLDDVRVAIAFMRTPDGHLLCYVRGPEGIIVALAEELG